MELLPARFQGPSKNGCYFFGLFILFLFFHVSSASSKRVLKKTLSLWGSWNTLLKHLVTSCSNNEIKPKPFSFENPLTKTLLLHHPLKTVHKNLKKKLFLLVQKRWPSYWPWGGQVIDLEVAKLLTLKWPKCGQVIDPTAHIYIYTHTLWSYYLVQIWTFNSYHVVQVCCFLTVFLKKHCTNRGFGRFLNKKECTRQSLIVIIWSKFAFLKRTQLGADDNPTLDQRLTLKNGHCLPFFVFKSVLKYKCL